MQSGKWTIPFDNSNQKCRISILPTSFQGLRKRIFQFFPFSHRLCTDLAIKQNVQRKGIKIFEKLGFKMFQKLQE